MTIQELINYAVAKGIPFDMPIAIRDKDDYLLVSKNISTDEPYFGNCPEGENYLQSVVALDADGDYEKIPKFLILSTGY